MLYNCLLPAALLEFQTAVAGAGIVASGLVFVFYDNARVHFLVEYFFKQCVQFRIFPLQQLRLLEEIFADNGEKFFFAGAAI